MKKKLLFQKLFVCIDPSYKCMSRERNSSACQLCTLWVMKFIALKKICISAFQVFLSFNILLFRVLHFVQFQSISCLFIKTANYLMDSSTMFDKFSLKEIDWNYKFWGLIFILNFIYIICACTYAVFVFCNLADVP